MNTASIRALEREILDDIPLARAIDLRIFAADGDTLTLAAPLGPNINDKGCAFGGSLASLLTLAGWSLLSMQLRAAGEDCDVYVQDSHLRYLAPVWGDLHATARLADGEDWKNFFGMLASRGKGRLSVIASVPGENGAPATTLQARFVALRRAANVGAA